MSNENNIYFNEDLVEFNQNPLNFDPRYQRINVLTFKQNDITFDNIDLSFTRSLDMNVCFKGEELIFNGQNVVLYIWDETTGYIDATFPSLMGNTYLVQNSIDYKVLNPKNMTFNVSQKSEITVMAWGPGGNSGPNKSSTNLTDYANAFCDCESTCNPSLPKDGSWVWYPTSSKPKTSYYDTFTFNYPKIVAPFGGGGSGAFAESTISLDAGTYYYSIGVTSGTRTWFGPSMNPNSAYVIADTGYDSTNSINKVNRDNENPNVNLETKSISFGGKGGQISQSKGDTILGGNKGTDSYSASQIIGGTGGAAVNPMGNYNGAGGSFGGYGDAGKILLKIESAALNTFDFGSIYYNFNSQNNDNNSAGFSGKIVGTFEVQTSGSIDLSNMLLKHTRFAGYSDNEYQNITNGTQSVPGTWTDSNGVTFSYVNLQINLSYGHNTGFDGKINGYVQNNMRTNKRTSFNTLRCWITGSQIGDRECNC